MEKLSVSEKIIAYRTKNKLTQKVLGDRLGVSAQAVSKWERCQSYPDIALLPALARLIGCRIDEFFEV